MWRKPQVWIGFIISALALYLAFHGINWSELGENLRVANYSYLLLSAGALVIAIWIRAERWRWLFGVQRDKVTRTRAFNATSIGYLVTNIFPLRLGELARIFFISRDGKVSVALAASTIVVEHVLDVLTVLGILIVIVLGGSLPVPDWARQGAAVAGVAFGGALIVMLISVWQRQRVERLSEILFSSFGRLDTQKWVGVVSNILDGFAVLRQGRPLVMVVFWSIVGWLCSAVTLHLALLAFLPSPPFAYSLFTTVTTTFILLLPATPGGVGTLDWAMQQSLVVFGVSATLALGFALVFHAMEIIVMDLLGVVCLLREAGSWATAKAQLRSATSTAEVETTGP